MKEKHSSLLIEGGYPLAGKVKVSGAKNAALPILAACIMLDGEIEINNVPFLQDVKTMIKMLNALGIRTEHHKEHTIKIWNNKKIRHIAPYDLVTSMRASFFVAGPLLAKTGYAKVSLPGGCCIGSRPIDLHLKGFKQLGATANIEHGFVELRAKSLNGTNIHLDFPSVGATENIMMAACFAKGKTVIENAAREPEIVDLGQFLNQAGAKITGLGTSVISIEHISSLKGIKYKIIPDRVEAGTLLIAGAVSKGNIIVENVIPQHIESLIQKLMECGCHLSIEKDTVAIQQSGNIKAINIDTLPFPGFPTDMQAQMMTLLCLAKGSSAIKEMIFENRFMHAHELVRMGAYITLDRHYAFITGTEKLSGAEVKITDLRAGAALIIAGLAAEGQTRVYGLKHLKRGYDDLPSKLRQLGGRIIN